MAIIDKPSDYFNTVLYTGTGSSHAITGVGFAPNWVWIKHRNEANPHKIFDTVRGVGKSLKSNSTDAEATNEENGYVSEFGSDGFTVVSGSTSSNDVNKSSGSYTSWNWKAGGTASSNTDGSITSSVSANQDAGFSIVKYDSTRTPSAVQTVGHNLGVSPDVLIFKNLNETQNWLVWHKDIATDKHLNLNTTSALNTDAGSLNNTAPTSSVFTIGADGRTNSTTEGNPIVCYAFAEKKGFSKFGSYTGNGSTDGTFVYTGFKPAFVMWKNTTTGSTNWHIVDNKRDTFNIVDKLLLPNGSGSEITQSALDLTSNGFKIKVTNGFVNTSGNNYIYMAFAENPFVSSTGVPATAR
jgi:hypothetical protein